MIITSVGPPTVDTRASTILPVQRTAIGERLPAYRRTGTDHL
jgi:hypothetical protein